MAQKVKEQVLLQALLDEPTITKAAERAGVDRKTIYRYMQKPAFRKDLEAKKAEMVAGAVRYLQGKLAECSEILMRIARTPQKGDTVRISAINTIFQNCKSMTETADILVKMQEIEEMLEGDNDAS